MTVESMTDSDAYFYFSRKLTMPRDGSRHLVSGVIKASDIDEAERKLDALLLAKRTPARASDFAFLDLAAEKCEAHGVIAITIGE